MKAYIPFQKSPTMRVPGSRSKVAHVLRSSGRGSIVVNGLGATNTPSPLPPTDAEFRASMAAPGESQFQDVASVQCALNAQGASPVLAVDNKWGPRTSAALSAFVASVRASVKPPDTEAVYSYRSPTAGSGAVSMTNALYAALTSGVDVSACLQQLAVGAPGAGIPIRQVAPTHATTTDTTTHTTAPATPKWLTPVLVGAGVLAVGAVGWAFFKKGGHKKGRRRKKGR